MKKPIIDMKLIKAAASRTAFGNISAPILPLAATPRKEKANRTREKSLNFRVSTAIFEETRNAAATLRITQVEFIEQAIQAQLAKVKEERRRVGADWHACLVQRLGVGRPYISHEQLHFSHHDLSGETLYE